MNSAEEYSSLLLLDRLGWTPSRGPEPLARVKELEKLIGVGIPLDYRNFLLSTGGGNIEPAVASCTVPTPLDHIVTCLHSVDEVIDLLGSAVAPRNMICVGYGDFGLTTCLSVAASTMDKCLPWTRK